MSSEGSQDPQDAREAQKAKMREALKRKAQHEHASAERARNTGTVHGAEVAGGAGKRRFRRKSG